MKLRLTHHTPRITFSSLPIYFSLLFLAFHYYLIVYINSNYLATFIPDTYIGYLYIIGSLCNIGGLLYSHKLLRRFGNVRLAIVLVILEIISLLLLGFGWNFGVIAFAFILQHTINPIILFCLDVFMESKSKNEHTGNDRGTFLTILNTPAILGALLSGLLLVHAEFYKVYFASALFLLPLLIILLTSFRKFKDPHYKKVNVLQAIDRFEHNRLVRDIFIDNIVLQFFYALMTIYLPVYLNRVVGLSLGQIGLIFSIALLPFILLQIPIGKLADKKYGEKEFLIGSFILMSFATISISFITTESIIVWIFILLLTRIGAAIVEISTESYFFKHVEKTDADMIGLFRMAHAIAFSSMPLLGVASLIFLPIQYIFIAFGILILLIGLRYAFDLTDTR